MKTVLVADDAAFMRASMSEILVSNGFEVVAEAGDGLQAIQLYEEHRPDVVTMDITMPTMDGLTAIRKIMELDPNASIVVCSAIGHRDMVVEAIRAGAKDFIIKPFHRNRVVSTLRDVLSY
ncbi:response regulator [Paenibacillus sp. CAU 1782]